MMEFLTDGANPLHPIPEDEIDSLAFPDYALGEPLSCEAAAVGARTSARAAVHVSVLGALVFVLALSACAGGGDEGVSKDAFVRDANAICRENAEAIDALGPEPGYAVAGAVKWFERLVAIQRDSVSKLSALRPPDEDKATIAEMLSKWQRAVDDAGPELVASVRSRDFQRFNRAVDKGIKLLQEGDLVAAEYGLDDCATFGLR